MSQLAPFVRVLRALGSAMQKRADMVREEAEAEESGPMQEASFDRCYLLGDLADGFKDAATDLEQQIATDLARMNRKVEVFDITQRETGASD